MRAARREMEGRRRAREVAMRVLFAIAGTLAATRLRIDDAKMIAPHVTNAIVGRISNSLGQMERKWPSPSRVVLYTCSVSADVPTMVTEERRARTVRPRFMESMPRGLCLMAGCWEVGGASKEVTSDAASGFEKGILAI